MSRRRGIRKAQQSPFRRLAEATARNRLNQRGFRERGRRDEFISDLVSDLELLFARAGVEQEEEKRQTFVR